MKRLAPLAIALALVHPSGPALADPALIASCAAANPAFPQLCPCAVQSGAAAGIGPADLGKLVTNQFLGVSPAAVAAWGPVFATCTANAVNADLGLPGTGGVNPPQPAPTTPQRQAPAPNAPAPSAPEPAAGFALTQIDPASPGVWGRVRWGRPGSGRLMTGARAEEGPMLALQCSATAGTEFPFLLLGPFGPGPAVLQATLRVDGRTPFTRGVPLQRIEGGYYAGALYEQMAAALARGSNAALDLGPLGTVTVGLRGSSRAMQGARGCGGRIGFTRALAHPQRHGVVFEGRWTLSQQRVGRFDQPVLSFPRAQGVAVGVGLSCDGRILFGANVGAAPLPLPGAVSYRRGAEEVEHVFTFRAGPGNIIGSDPLDRPILDEMAAAERVTVTFNADFAPGADFDAIYAQTLTTTGLAEGLDALICPPPPTLSPEAQVDLTASGGVWVPLDMAQPNGSATPVPAAAFEGDARPGLLMYCGPAPFFFSNELFETSDPYHFRFEVDGDAASAVEAEFLVYRALRHANWQQTDPLAPRMLTGQTLRVTMLQNPEIDVLYPLAGLGAALAAAGCPR
ncbi:MAG: hypothetical protein AAF281_01560 [Pseudomonadota bacterium]